MTAHDLDYYGRMIDTLDDETVARYDREESGEYDGGTWEHEQHAGHLNFAALQRSERIAVLRALDENLPTRTKRVYNNGITSYALKHDVERLIGHYVSNLQLKVGMRILGYVRAGDGLNPRYNIAVKEWRRFRKRSMEVQRQRYDAIRIAKLERRCGEGAQGRLAHTR